MATAYAYLVLMPETLLLASVNLGEFEPHRQLESVGYDMVKHVKIHC